MLTLMRAGRIAAALVSSVLFATAAHAASAPTATPPSASPPAQARPLALAQPVPAIVLPDLSVPVEPSTANVPLSTLVSTFDEGNDPLDEQSECLAKAVYFEARGEPLEGQLAVAKVVLNRAGSGIYPSSICEVVTQRGQFSFVRGGHLPAVDESTETWRTAVAIAHIARSDLAPSVADNVLWYHATYVLPPWDRWHTMAARIGAHLFYS